MTSTLLLVATAVHLGFQVSVTLLVYPALGRVGAASWPVAHAAHSRAIVPLVVVVYGTLVLSGTAAALTTPDDVWVWLAGAASLAAGLVTALRAAPLHGRLAQGYDESLVRALLRADRLRLAAAVVAVAAALLAVG